MSGNMTIDVVDQIDISNLVGLQIYVGFGKSWNDMWTTPGKLALIYTVPAPLLTSLTLASPTIAAGTTTKVLPVPSAANLGSCRTDNETVATVAGNVVTGNSYGWADIICGVGNNIVSTTVAVTNPPLSSIQLVSPTIAIGQVTPIMALPNGSVLGTCTSSNTNVATVQGSAVTAVGAGTATITCSGKSATVTVPAPSCKQVAAGTYSGGITGSYTGSATMTLAQQNGYLDVVSGSVSIDGLGTVSLSGEVAMPTINLFGYCAANGSTFQCFSANGAWNQDGEIVGSYWTADGGSGNFDLQKSCP
jgi:hypothetical protein